MCSLLAKSACDFLGIPSSRVISCLPPDYLCARDENVDRAVLSSASGGGWNRAETGQLPPINLAEAFAWAHCQRGRVYDSLINLLQDKIGAG